MVGGVDRYFQLARCYRDEDLRADRQPEFTQLDLEMSFIDENGIMNLIENLTKFISSEINIERKMNPPPFPRLPYKEAMEKYGSDKPDTRYEMSIQQRQIVIEGQQWTVRAFCVPEGKVCLNLRTYCGTCRYVRTCIHVPACVCMYPHAYPYVH